MTQSWTRCQKSRQHRNEAEASDCPNCLLVLEPTARLRRNAVAVVEIIRPSHHSSITTTTNVPHEGASVGEQAHSTSEDDDTTASDGTTFANNCVSDRRGAVSGPSGTLSGAATPPALLAASATTPPMAPRKLRNRFIPSASAPAERVSSNPVLTAEEIATAIPSIESIDSSSAASVSPTSELDLTGSDVHRRLRQQLDRSTDLVTSLYERERIARLNLVQTTTELDAAKMALQTAQSGKHPSRTGFRMSLKTFMALLVVIVAMGLVWRFVVMDQEYAYIARRVEAVFGQGWTL